MINKKNKNRFSSQNQNKIKPASRLRKAALSEWTLRRSPSRPSEDSFPKDILRIGTNGQVTAGTKKKSREKRSSSVEIKNKKQKAVRSVRKVSERTPIYREKIPEISGFHSSFLWAITAICL